MADSREYEDWVRYAEDDYQGALDLLEAHPRIATRLFHESAEKYLKAVLVYRKIEPSRTHNLRLLLSEVDATLSGTSLEVSAAALLTVASPIGRYPSEFSEPTKEEAEALARASGTLRDFVRKLLSLSDNS
jgi:HEPN domain-containing protein